MNNKPAGAFSDPNLLKRVVSALILAPLVVYIGYLGGVPFMVLFYLIGLVVVYEWMTMAQKIGEMPQAFVMSIVYAGLFVKCAIMLRMSPEYGLAALLWLTLIVWGTDCGAYFAGRAIGGPKLAPRYSPNKTWSGAIGGAIVGTLAACYAMTFFKIPVTSSLIAVSLVTSAFSQMGDIFESSLKRRYGVKDSSNLIPGHGGVMDRMDGFLIAVIIAFVIGFVHNNANAAQGLLVW
jgi:phosphatidate cytidylyltransferase